MRNEDSSTLQYSSLIPLTDLLAFIPCCSPVSHCSTRPLYSTWSFKLKCDLGTEYDERFGFQDRIYTPLSTVREKKQKWGHTAPRTSYRNYRNNESSICCDNFNELGGEWFYCSTETVNTNPRVMVMPVISPLPILQCCSANVKLILIKPLEIEGLLILCPAFWHSYFSENKSSVYICLLCSLLVYEDADIEICAKPTN